MHPDAVLHRLGQDSGLAPALLEPARGLLERPPAGSVEATELDALDTAAAERAALLLAILAATDFRRHGELLDALLRWLLPREAALDPYDRGRLWHLRGFAAWRLEQAMLAAYDGLERSLQLLTPLETQPARAYLGRVWNTFAQLMHHQGRFHEARFGFETALGYRQSDGDPVDRAFTLGNLARVCMDFGDYAAALDHFREDLAISRSIAATPPHVEVQLLSEIAACHLLLDQLEPALARYRESEALARRHDNGIGRLFAGLGLGRVALARQPADRDAALDQLATVRALLQDTPMPEGLRTELGALAQELEGDIHAAAGEPARAIVAYAPARAHFESMATAVPREIVQLLYKLAQAQLAAGNEMEGAMTLRAALSRVDATSLDDLRGEIEALFKRRFPQFWMLHAAGRFIGQRQIDRFLEQAGQSGFLGSRQQMAVLFSDIRGFTGLSEGLEAEELIRLLNDFLTRMTRSIERFGGEVDKFIGDAVMAIFPTEDPGASCLDATRAALMMQAELAYFNRELARHGQHLGIGIGIHFGPLVSGLIGSPQKRSFTVIGDVVNTASRLEGMTKPLGAGILLSEAVASRLPADAFLLRPLGRYSPKGRNQSIGVFDLLGENGVGLHREALAAESRACERLFADLAVSGPEAALEGLARLAEACPHPGRAGGYRTIAGLIRQQQQRLPERSWSDGILLTEK